MCTLNASIASKAFNSVENLLSYAYFRWIDECKYEDINSYAAPFEAKLSEVCGEPVKVKMSKRPFGCKVQCDYTYKDGVTRKSVLEIYATLRQMGWRVKNA